MTKHITTNAQNTLTLWLKTYPMLWTSCQMPRAHSISIRTRNTQKLYFKSCPWKQLSRYFQTRRLWQAFCHMDAPSRLLLRHATRCAQFHRNKQTLVHFSSFLFYGAEKCTKFLSSTKQTWPLTQVWGKQPTLQLPVQTFIWRFFPNSNWIQADRDIQVACKHQRKQSALHWCLTRCWCCVKPNWST